MANEITAVVSLSCRNGNFSLPPSAIARTQITQNGVGGGAPGMIQVGSSEVAVDLSQINTPGWVYMRNFDTGQSVIWGPEDSGAMVPFGVMKPGEPAAFRLHPNTVIRMQVDSETEDSEATSEENEASVQIFVLED
jgi:hypothetical protein